MLHIPQQPPADRETLEILFYTVKSQKGKN